MLEDCGLKGRFAADELNRWIGTLEVNNHEIHLTSSGAGYRAFYPVAHLMSHVCAPNSVHVRDTTGRDGYAAKCVATVDIRAGEDIVTNVRQTLSIRTLILIVFLSFPFFW